MRQLRQQRKNAGAAIEIVSLCRAAVSLTNRARAASRAHRRLRADPKENNLRLLSLVCLALLCFPAVAPAADIWITDAEIASLPTSGPAWDNVKSAADNATGGADLQDLTSNHDVDTLALALVAVRLGLNGAGAGYRAAAADHIMSAIGTEGGTSELQIARNTTSYVIAADLIDFKTFRPTDEAVFRRWLVDLRYQCFGRHSFYSASEKRGNNWGTMSSAARLATALYARKYGVPAGTCLSFGSCNLSDAALYCSNPDADITRLAAVWKGYLGDRSSYAEFAYGELSWQFDSSRPVGINPVGATKKATTSTACCLMTNAEAAASRGLRTRPATPGRGCRAPWSPPRCCHARDTMLGTGKIKQSGVQSSGCTPRNSPTGERTRRAATTNGNRTSSTFAITRAFPPRCPHDRAS